MPAERAAWTKKRHTDYDPYAEAFKGKTHVITGGTAPPCKENSTAGLH